MSSPRLEISIEALNAALVKHGPNKSAIALELGTHRQTISKVMAELGMSDKPIVARKPVSREPNIKPLPPEGVVQRYLLSAAQNNTQVHSKFVRNLEAYRDWLGNCEIMISRFSYNKNAYNNSYMSKPGHEPTADSSLRCWYDQGIEKYVCDDVERHGSCKYQLAPDLLWCAER